MLEISGEDSILIIGLHTRPAVFSAKTLGLYTFSVDYFGDVDLKTMADVSRSIREQKPFQSSGRLSENYSGEGLKTLSKDLDADRTVCTCSADVGRRVVGNPSEKVLKLKDKERQLKKIRKLGVNVPKTEVVEDRKDAIEAAQNLGFPCVLKPVRGAGGQGVLLLRSDEKGVPEIRGKYLVQEYVKGVPISTSTLSTKKESMLLSTSQQILGSGKVGQRGFVYCGNTVPLELDRKGCEELEEISNRLTRSFGVVGWNGFDFVLQGEPVFMEVNPRFQGTFDCIERSYGINLLDAHIKACGGELIKQPVASKTSVRLTMFAKERCMVREDLRGKTVDVPLKNSIIEKGEPITTVVTTGKREEDAVEKSTRLVQGIYRDSILPWTR